MAKGWDISTQPLTCIKASRTEFPGYQLCLCSGLHPCGCLQALQLILALHTYCCPEHVPALLQPLPSISLCSQRTQCSCQPMAASSDAVQLLLLAAWHRHNQVLGTVRYSRSIWLSATALPCTTGHHATLCVPDTARNAVECQHLCEQQERADRWTDLLILLCTGW